MAESWTTRVGRRLRDRLDLATGASVQEATSKIIERMDRMADQITTTLNSVAERVGGELRDAVVQLINDDKAKAARLAELEGTEVAQSEAAQRVVDAVNGLAADLTRQPEAPDVEPLPEVPADPTEPVTDDGSTTPDAGVPGEVGGEVVDSGPIGGSDTATEGNGQNS